MFTTIPSKEFLQASTEQRSREHTIDFGRLQHLQDGSLVNPLLMPGVEITHQPSNRSNTDVIVWQSRVPAGEHYFPPSDKYMLSLCLGDIQHGIWHHGGRTFEGRLKINDLLIKAIGSPAYHRSETSCDFFHLGFSTQYLQTVTRTERKTQRLDLGEFLGLQDLTLNSLMGTLRPTLSNNVDISPTFVDTVARAVLLHLREHHQQNRVTTKGLNDTAYEAVISYLNDHTDRTTSVAEIARNIGMDAVLLSRLYKQRTGDTLGKLGLNIRLAKAFEMLQTKRISATQVAMDTGFNDLPHFSRHFKKHFGMSPSTLFKH